VLRLKAACQADTLAQYDGLFNFLLSASLMGISTGGLIYLCLEFGLLDHYASTFKVKAKGLPFRRILKEQPQETLPTVLDPYETLSDRFARARRAKLQEANQSYLAPELTSATLSGSSGEDDLTASEDASITSSKPSKRVTWADAERLKERDRSSSPSPVRRKVSSVARRRKR
jgi:hypothetical protein